MAWGHPDLFGHLQVAWFQSAAAVWQQGHTCSVRVPVQGLLTELSELSWPIWYFCTGSFPALTCTPSQAKGRLIHYLLPVSIKDGLEMDSFQTQLKVFSFQGANALSANVADLLQGTHYSCQSSGKALLTLTGYSAMSCSRGNNA